MKTFCGIFCFDRSNKAYFNGKGSFQQSRLVKTVSNVWKTFEQLRRRPKKFYGQWNGFCNLIQFDLNELLYEWILLDLADSIAKQKQLR